MNADAVSLAPETAPPTAVQDRRLLFMIGLNLTVAVFASGSGLGSLPLKYLLKNHLHLGATALAGFFALTGLAWYFKPLAGFFSDNVRLLGTRRRHYLLLSSLGGAAFWVLLAFVPPQYGPLLWTAAAINTMCMVISSVSGGLIVEAGQRSGMTGRLSVMRQVIQGGTVPLAGLAGGFLAAQAFGWTCVVGAALFLVLLPAVAFLMPEQQVRERRVSFKADLKTQFGAMRHSRTLWIAVAFIFFDNISPGFGTPLFYYQTNTLKFSSQFIGTLGLLAGVGGMFGVTLYGFLCRHVPLGRLLAAGIVLSTAGSLLFLGYHSPQSAMTIEVANTFFSVAVNVALLDLAARATPRGSEALSYSLLMSAFNLAASVSDVFGSWLYDKHHLPLPDLIWINAATSLLPLLAVPLIPRALLATPDGVKPISN